ncbi:rhomboid family protein [Hyaloraphidium curvatum]|nr:rhomboid family protein [Hyaloraphidium curvatum]
MSNIATLLRGAPVTRALVAASIVLSGVGFVLRNGGGKTAPLVAMVPAFALWYPWTFLTAGLHESNILTLLTNVVCLLFGGRYLEVAWGSRHFLIFALLVTVSTSLLTCITMLAEYSVTRAPEYIYETEAIGLVGLLSGFLVAFKQLVPEHRLSFFRDFFSIRVKYLPSIFLLVYAVLFFARVFHVPFLMALYGTIASWIYIRFYKVQDGIRGDRSETFSFASFWPDALHPFIMPLSNSCFNLMVTLRICAPLTGAGRGAYELPISRTGASGAGDGPDAERRRALALKALDQRLQTAPNQAQPPPPQPPPAVAAPTANGAEEAKLLAPGESQ